MKKIVLSCVLAFFLQTLIPYKIYAQITSGFYHSLAICGNGQVMAWGYNGYGQLGDGTIVDKNTPVQINGLNNVISISNGILHSLALKSDGTVWAWGANNAGQLGDGTTVDKNFPVQVPGLSNVIAITCGNAHSLALKSDGSVWTWGKNYFGQLGIGNTTDKHSPVKVTGVSNVVAIFGGNSHTLVLKSDGTVWSWGRNGNGQLGDGGTTDRFYPSYVYGLTNVRSISGGEYHSLALKNDGTVWSWGFNVYGQLGNGTNTDLYTPDQILTLNNVVAISGGNHSLALKTDGSVWAWGNNQYGELGDGTILSKNAPIQISGLNNVRAIKCGVNTSLALKNDGTVWATGNNTNGQLGDGTFTDKSIPVQITGLCYITPSGNKFDHFVHGTLYHDANNDCVNQTAEIGLSLFVKATPNNFYSFPNDSGHYSLGLLDSVNYTISPIIPQRLSHIVKNPCPGSYSKTFNATDPKDTTGFDFGLEATPCYQLRVDISSNRRRRCFKNFTTVFYKNEGIIAANGVEVHVKMPHYVIPVSASLAYTWDAGDSSMVFNIGTLNANQYGYISIIDSVACINNITGLTQCTKAWILPPNTCILDSAGAGWDNSSIKVKGNCVNNTVHFFIYNNGSGNMSTVNQYRVFTDNALMQTGSFQLNSGDSLLVMVASAGATIRLEADQHPDHPGISHPRATIEACGTNGFGTYSVGMVNQVPMDDEDVDIEIDCLEIRDSYDPNEKVVSPEGVDVAHNVIKGTLLDYIIHFQNTGSDTAYKVIIVDTLSKDFDLSTLEPGVGSHPYTLSVSGKGKPILTFTFNNINLPDSTTDELQSHGFVKFKIAPFNATVLGTQIDNFASIYFDFNFPIYTNTAFVTLGNYPVINPLSLSELKADDEIISVYPNPARDKLSVNYNGASSANFTIFDIRGNIFYQTKMEPNQKIETIDVSVFPAGVYFLNIKNKSGVTTKKLVVMK